MSPKMSVIAEIFDECEEDFPNKSTEFLMQMTCDVYLQRFRKEIDHGDVATALYEQSLMLD